MKYESGGKYELTNTQINREMKKAKENWIKHKFSDIGECLNKNNTKKSYQIVNDLTKQKRAIIYKTKMENIV